MQLKSKKPSGLPAQYIFCETEITQSMIDSGLSALDISKQIERCARMYGDTSTIHLDIKTLLIPAVVIDGINKLVGFGAGIVVTHNGCSTADQNSSIDIELLKAVQKAARYGQVWHPQERKLIHTRPKFF